jgi:chromosome partitioning protein
MNDRYDYIVMDLAPSLSLTTLAALAACTQLVVPVSGSMLAMAALGTFLGWLDEFRREDVILAELAGVLPTMIDVRTRSSREVLEALAASGLPVFEPVPKRVAVEDQIGARILAVEEPGVVGDAYRKLAADLIVRLEGAG